MLFPKYILPLPDILFVCLEAKGVFKIQPGVIPVKAEKANPEGCEIGFAFSAFTDELKYLSLTYLFS